jgi:hypothetical protein
MGTSRRDEEVANPPPQPIGGLGWQFHMNGAEKSASTPWWDIQVYLLCKELILRVELSSSGRGRNASARPLARHVGLAEAWSLSKTEQPQRSGHFARGQGVSGRFSLNCQSSKLMGESGMPEPANKSICAGREVQVSALAGHRPQMHQTPPWGCCAPSRQQATCWCVPVFETGVALGSERRRRRPSAE